MTVLTTGFWPTYKFTELALPTEMVRCVETFKTFYEERTKHRKLTWIYALGTLTVKGALDAKPIELHVSPFQASALLLFNKEDTLSYGDIATALNLPDEDVRRTLHSLACSKYKILKKSPEGRTVSASDSFSYNPGFNDRARGASKSRCRRWRTARRCCRTWTTTAACHRRRDRAHDEEPQELLAHQKLVLEAQQQLSKGFKPDFKIIKKRIEDLVTREFLERDKEDPSVFNYRRRRDVVCPPDELLVVGRGPGVHGERRPDD